MVKQPESVLIASFEKNSEEEVCIHLSTFKGKRYIDIRAHYHGPEGLLPTKKGLTLALELLPELEAALAKVKKGENRNEKR